jgi:hypothetical protein
MIKKIKNLKLSVTDEKLKNDWNEVKSYRNRLLQNSDWINMADNNLEESIVEAWKDWRARVRRVEEFKDLQKAYAYLGDLQNNVPPVKYKNSDYASVEAYKVDLHKLLKTAIKKATDSTYETMDTRELLMERFEEALRYIDGKTDHNFLIELEVERTGLPVDDVVERFLEDRKNYLIKLITIEKVKNKFLKRIETVENKDDCDSIRDDLLILGSKKWI